MAGNEVVIDSVDDISSGLNDLTNKEPSYGDSHIDHLRIKIEALENENLDLAREKGDAEKTISGLKAVNEELSRQNLDLVTEKDGAKRKIVELESQIGVLEDDKEKMRHEIDEMKKAEAERSQEERRLMELIAKKAGQLESDVATLQHDLITATNAANESRRESAELRREVEVLKGDKALLEEEVSRVMILEKEKEVLMDEVKGLVEKTAKLSEKSNESVAQVDELMKKVLPAEASGIEREMSCGFGGLKVPSPVVIGAASAVLLVAVIGVSCIKYSRRV